MTTYTIRNKDGEELGVSEFPGAKPIIRWIKSAIRSSLSSESECTVTVRNGISEEKFTIEVK